MKSHIDVFIASNNGTPSFNPLDSDGTSNAIHVEQLVGTLVRMHPSGRYQGYLAESWSNTPDFKEWTFKIKSGLSCEDGTPITGESFAKSLHQVIRLFKSHSELPLIDRLQGFNDFEKSGNIFGIQGQGQTLSLKFAKPVEAGLLEYLALPFLGFYCEKNFNADGSWKDNSKIISSAAYRLDNWNGTGPVPMKLRKDWVKMVDNPPESLTIHTQGPDKIVAPKERGFIFSYLLEEKNTPQGYQVVKMLPTIFNGIMISPQHNEWLKNANNRGILRDAIKEAQKQIPLTISSAVAVNNFYPNMSEVAAQKSEDKKVTEKPKKPLVIVTSEKPTPQTEYQLSVIKLSLENLKISYEIKIRDSGQKDMIKNYRDPKNYDLQPVGVNIGGGIENQLIKFMFCSNLGVSFPDPSKRICALVDEYERKFGDVVPQEAMKEYIKKFDAYVWEDASVVPIIKVGHAWLLSPDLPVDNVNPTMDTPYFDLFNLE
ncbi:MAG: ABC transporter substrate-binding protein [Pseudobdellovibrionaceae bacterium]